MPYPQLRRDDVLSSFTVYGRVNLSIYNPDNLPYFLLNHRSGHFYWSEVIWPNPFQPDFIIKSLLRSTNTLAISIQMLCAMVAYCSMVATETSIRTGNIMEVRPIYFAHFSPLSSLDAEV